MAGAAAAAASVATAATADDSGWAGCRDLYVYFELEAEVKCRINHIQVTVQALELFIIFTVSISLYLSKIYQLHKVYVIIDMFARVRPRLRIRLDENCSFDTRESSSTAAIWAFFRVQRTSRFEPVGSASSIMLG